MHGHILFFGAQEKQRLEGLFAEAPFELHFDTLENADLMRCRRDGLAIVGAGDPQHLPQKLTQLRYALTRPTPPIAYFCNKNQRLQALRAGVDDVFDPHTPQDQIFARLRNLMRRDPIELPLERLQERRGMTAHFALLGADRLPQSLRARLERSRNIHLSELLPQDIHKTAPPDVFLLNGCNLSSGEVLLQIALLLGRNTTQGASPVVILLEPHQAETAARALDLGVEDVLFTTLSTAELHFRLRHIVAKARLAQSQRNRLATQLLMAITDPLTGLDNRAAVLPQLERLAQRAPQRPYTIMMIDVDHFKSINDTYGHVVGDEALVHIARVLRDAMRGSDILARFGGEEFIALLPDLDAAHAQLIADRMRERLERSPLSLKGGLLKITASIGICHGAPLSADPNAPLSQLYAPADAALYRAKREGRNRTVLASPESHMT